VPKARALANRRLRIRKTAKEDRVSVPASLLPTILISTEDMELYLLLDHILRFEGFASRLVSSVEEIQALLQVAPSAMVLVESRHSAEAFRDLCLTLRQDKAVSGVPILALIVQRAEREYVSAIGPEIADILVRPIWPAKLIQSIKCALRRRREAATAADTAPKPIQYADIEMDLASYRVWRGGREIHLSPTEFKLLRHLLERPEQVVTRHELRIAAWPRNIHVGPRTIDVHVGRLRRALNMGTEANLVRTIRSVGWALSTGSAGKAATPIVPGEARTISS
jgi:two-component system phosphate regulon response regulator PhoB